METQTNWKKTTEGQDRSSFWEAKGFRVTRVDHPLDELVGSSAHDKLQNHHKEQNPTELPVSGEPGRNETEETARGGHDVVGRKRR